MPRLPMSQQAVRLSSQLVCAADVAAVQEALPHLSEVCPDAIIAFWVKGLQRSVPMLGCWPKTPAYIYMPQYLIPTTLVYPTLILGSEGDNAHLQAQCTLIV